MGSWLPLMERDLCTARVKPLDGFSEEGVVKEICEKLAEREREVSESDGDLGRGDSCASGSTLGPMSRVETDVFVSSKGPPFETVAFSSSSSVQ